MSKSLSKSEPVATSSSNKKLLAPTLIDKTAVVPIDTLVIEGTDDWTVPSDIRQNKYFVLVTTSLPDALKELDKRMQELSNREHHLVTHKKKRMWGGKCVSAGDIGIWNRNGRPVIALQPGNYWNRSFSHKWVGSQSITSSLNVLGLTTCLVGQSEAAVVLDPVNRIFVIRNSGFAAYGLEGNFRVVEIVDTLNLGDQHAFYEQVLPPSVTSRSGGGGSSTIIGWKRDVHFRVGTSDVIVATFFKVPANNVLMLQRGNDMLMLSAGQHVVTNPNTSFRGFYSLSERQTTFKTQPAYTVEGVPVVLNVNLRYRIEDPVLLTRHYNDAFSALANPAQTAVNGVVSRLSYQQFMRAQKVGGDVPDHIEPWLDAFKSACLSDLQTQAMAYGIVVESFDVLDRELEGALGKDLEKQSEQVLRNQMQASQVALQNQIATETQQGKLQIAQVEAKQRQTVADADYYVRVKEAEGKATSSKMTVGQDSLNIVTLAEAKQKEIELIGSAYAKVPDGHAQRMQLSVYEVEKRKALPEKTIYFTTENSETQRELRTGFVQGAGFRMSST